MTIPNEMGHIEWFEIVGPDDPLSQGDILFSVPIVFSPSDPDDLLLNPIPIKIERNDGIILTQTCDFENDNVEMVLFCPIFPLDEFAGDLADSATPKAIKSTKDRLWDGKYLAYYVLNKCELEGSKNDYYVVDLKNPRSIPLDFVKNISKRHSKRIRLRSPYREDLSQKFAYVIMRVGLPDKKPDFS